MPIVQTMRPGELARPALRKKPYPEDVPPVAAPSPMPQVQPVPQVPLPAPTVPEVKPLIYGSQASRLLSAPATPAAQRPLREAGTFYGLPTGPAPEAAAGVPAEGLQPPSFQMKVDPPRPLPSEPEDEMERQRAAHEGEMKRLEGDPVTARFARQLRGLEADEKVMRENIRATLPEAEQEEMVKKLETELLFERLRVGKAMNQAMNAEAESLRTAAGIAHRKGQRAYEERMEADEKSRAEPQDPLLGWANTIGDALPLPGPLNPGWWVQKIADDFGPYDYQRKRVQQQVRSEEEAEVLRRAAVKKTGLDPDNPEHARLLEDAKQMDWTAGGRQVGESAASGTGMAEAESLKNTMIQSLTEGKWEVNRAENSRLLTDGSVVVNPLLIHDDAAYAKAVQEAQATPEAKRQAMDRLKDLQRGQAKALLPSLKSTPDFFPGEQFTDYAARRAQEEPAFGVLPEAEQARLYLREQMQRGHGTRLADKLGTSLLLGTGDFFTQVNGALAIPTGGLPGVGEFFSQGAADLAMLGAMVDESTEARTGTGALGRVTGGVARMLPPLVAQALITRGLRVNVLPEKAAKAVIYGLAGAQTAGGQYAALYGQLRQQGAGPMEAWMSASGPAMASGLATAGLTALGGATGTEALLLPGARGRVAQGVRGFWKEALKNVPAHAMKEVPEEFFDEMASTVIEAMALGKDPKEALGGFLAESPEFIGSVMLLGGSGGLHSSRQQAPVAVPAANNAATPTPPLWQGRARHGEDAAVLGRNPDGTFQVRLNGKEKTFKESQVAAMTGMQRGPLYEMLGRATVNREKKAGQAPLPPQAFAGVPSRRFQFSQTHPADSEVLHVHRQIAESEDAFQLGKSKPDSTSVQELVEAFSLQEQPLKLLEEKPYRGAGREYLLATPKGTVRMVELTREKEIFVDTSKAASNESKAGGGAQIYQLAQTYAHNKGFRFRADDSVSEIAQKRRISQMIASALRHGTTQHLKGDHEFVDENGQWQVDVPGWKPGDHDHNLALLLKAEHANVMQEAQARGIDLSHLTHDPTTDNILDGRTGTPITRATLESLVDRLEPG
ncbi:MAG: hypothetical protein V4599_12160, partial [Verrucomicrobiota bacterium]